MEGEVYMVYEQDIRLIKMTEVLKKTGMSKSTVYSLISHGMFPQQVSLGIRSVAFVEAEVDAWIRNKIANRNRWNTYRYTDKTNYKGNLCIDRMECLATGWMTWGYYDE